MNGPSSAAQAATDRRPSASVRPSDSAPRLDDLVREVAGPGVLAGRATLIAWGFSGFLIGAIFWQVIGFWGVLGEAILKRPEQKVSVVARVALPARLPNCTTLALDRATGTTVSIPCAERMPLLEEAGLMGRSDLVLADARLGDAARKSTPVLAPSDRQPARHDN
jgi:hypothetical protein